jgi:hypothetical protein
VTLVSKSKENWKAEPDEHDYPAASNYLSLLLPKGAVDAAVQGLRSAELVRYKAKDLLRASRLPLLPAKDPDVVRDLREVRAGRKLSPVLLLRGALGREVPLTVADGYHRICASYHLNEDAEIPCRLAELGSAEEIREGAAPKAPRGRATRSKPSAK